MKDNIYAGGLLNKEISIYKEEGQSDRFFCYIKSLSECDFIIKSIYNGADQKVIQNCIKKEKSKGGKVRALRYNPIKHFVKNEYEKLIKKTPKISNNKAVHDIIEKIKTDFKEGSVKGKTSFPH